MKGHLQLIAMRRRGFIPASVCLNDFPVADWVWRDWAQPISPESKVHADISIDPDDNPVRLDLRFCIGLLVHVICTERDRALALARAALDAGARRVGCCWGEGPAIESAIFDWAEDVPCN